MDNNNIDIISGNIVCTETNIKLTDEKLKNILSKTYETARKDARKFKLYNHYGIFLSIAFSLIISLLTSDFKSFGVVSASVLTITGWIVFGLCLLIGIILVLVSASLQGHNDTSERDEAIKTVMNEIQK